MTLLPCHTAILHLHIGNFTLVGLPAYLQRQRQLPVCAQRCSSSGVPALTLYDHITDALAVLHWLHVPQRVNYKVVVTAFRAPNGLSPPYLDQLVRVDDLPGRHRLRSSSSHRFQVPGYRLATVSRRSFPVAASGNGHKPPGHKPLPIRLS